MVDRKIPISFTPKNKTGATSLALRLARNSCFFYLSLTKEYVLSA